MGPKLTQAEGFILGVGAKMFTIAGPVIVYGVSASVVYGLIYWITHCFSGRLITAPTNSIKHYRRGGYYPPAKMRRVFTAHFSIGILMDCSQYTAKSRYNPVDFLSRGHKRTSAK